MGFFSGLFEGSSPGTTSSESTAGNITNFGTNLGESDLSTGSNFFKSLLSGNPQAIGQLLGPQLSTVQQQGQQQLNTNAQFGNRSGGTNASNQTNIDSQRQQVEQMIAQLTGSAASGVTGIGESAIGTGLSADQLQANVAQQLLQNQQQSLLGGVISGGAGIGLDFLSSSLGL
jgi:hypothetical protein